MVFSLDCEGSGIDDFGVSLVRYSADERERERLEIFQVAEKKRRRRGREQITFLCPRGLQNARSGLGRSWLLLLLLRRFSTLSEVQPFRGLFSRGRMAVAYTSSAFYVVRYGVAFFLLFFFFFSLRIFKIFVFIIFKI